MVRRGRAARADTAARVVQLLRDHGVANDIIHKVDVLIRETHESQHITNTTLPESNTNNDEIVIATLLSTTQVSRPRRMPKSRFNVLIPLTSVSDDLHEPYARLINSIQHAARVIVNNLAVGSSFRVKDHRDSVTEAARQLHLLFPAIFVLPNGTPRYQDLWAEHQLIHALLYSKQSSASRARRDAAIRISIASHKKQPTSTTISNAPPAL